MSGLAFIKTRRVRLQPVSVDIRLSLRGFLRKSSVPVQSTLFQIDGDGTYMRGRPAHRYIAVVERDPVWRRQYRLGSLADSVTYERAMRVSHCAGIERKLVGLYDPVRPEGPVTIRD